MSSSKLNYLLLGIAAVVGADLGSYFVNSYYDKSKEILKKEQSYIQIFQKIGTCSKKHDTGH